jgi:hypothetical protein
MRLPEFLPNGNASCREVYSLAATRSEDAGKRISEMEMPRDELGNLVGERNEKLRRVSEND